MKYITFGIRKKITVNAFFNEKERIEIKKNFSSGEQVHSKNSERVLKK